MKIPILLYFFRVGFTLKDFDNGTALTAKTCLLEQQPMLTLNFYYKQSR